MSNIEDASRKRRINLLLLPFVLTALLIFAVNAIYRPDRVQLSPMKDWGFEQCVFDGTDRVTIVNQFGPLTLTSIHPR